MIFLSQKFISFFAFSASLREIIARRSTKATKILILLLISCVGIIAQNLAVKTTQKPADFPLVHNKKASTIFFSAQDAKVVKIATRDLAADIERVTGTKPAVEDDKVAPTGSVVIVGTIGTNYYIDKWVQSGKLDVSKIGDKWESYLITVVKNPMPGVSQALVIAGSDRRGTAFGVYELSRIIGVSPWVWWADVAPEKKANLYISPGKITGGEPSVKYRGIFINDEDWGLQPWAAKTFEPETGDIGPKTYAKVFELMLRLKANTVWPAMHEVTKPFNAIPGNAQMADDYAIVMGSSHAEPMLRNNVGEWKDDKTLYDFKKNPDGVKRYWEDRVAASGKFENIYTLGMRGIHDSPIQGMRDQAERIKTLEEIITFQRSLLSKHVDPAAEKVPQIFCPYKEVLADYRAGLKVPDDVTIVFPDDNFGYIRQFPTAAEQKRAGGFGVYYHISYLGRPMSYVWLNTMPPALIWQQMSQAYDHNMRNLWIVNVGDIKPGEIGMELFLQMAWDIKKWRRENIGEYLKTFAAREFGAKDSAAIAEVMRDYYQLNFQRKPEHLQWHIPRELYAPSDLTQDEIVERLDRFYFLEERASKIYASLPEHKKAAYYQLVLYPVRMSRAANERVLAVEMAARFATKITDSQASWVFRAQAAEHKIKKETEYYNNTLSGGKWRGIMSPEMGAGQWPSMRNTWPTIPAPLSLEALSALPQETKPVKLSSKTFVETAGVISTEAENFTFARDVKNTGWQVINGLGRRGDSISVFPTTAQSYDTSSIKDAPYVEYEFTARSDGEFDASVYLLPTQPIKSGTGLRYAVAIDNQPTQIVAVDADTEVSSRKWSFNILNASTVGVSKIKLTPGKHVLRIYMVDAGVVIDNIVIDTGGLRPSYLGPPETRTK